MKSKTIPVVFSVRGGVTVASADSHVRVYAEMSMDEIKETVASLLGKLDRKDADELADKLTKEIYS